MEGEVCMSYQDFYLQKVHGIYKSSGRIRYLFEAIKNLATKIGCVCLWSRDPIFTFTLTVPCL